MTVDDIGTAVAARAAERVAAEVKRADAAGLQVVSKVTSLLHVFGANGQGLAGAKGAVAALAEQGIEMLPPLHQARRTECVAMVPSGRAGGVPTPPSASLNAQQSIRVSIWSPGVSGEETELQPDQSPESLAGSVRLFDVDPVHLSPRRLPSGGVATPHPALDHHTDAPTTLGWAPEDRVNAVFARLREHCPGLEPAMVRDLLTEDTQPKVEAYGNEADGVRGVSAVAVIARESAGTGVGFKSQELIFQTVEMIVGTDWIITCWHPSHVVTGPGQRGCPDRILREAFLGRVRRDWVMSSQARSAGDLGMMLGVALIGTYGASHRMIERWVESWERDFYVSLSSTQRDTLNNATTDISNLLSLIGEFRRRLTAFMQARHATGDKAWFPRLTLTGGPESAAPSEVLLSEVLGADTALDRLHQTIRADMDLLMLRSVGTQQASSQRLESQLAQVTALLLVPSLIAGIFGANTSVPGQDLWQGFFLMLLLMAVSSLAVYALMIREVGGPDRFTARLRAHRERRDS